jgi:hypothetical protein
VERIINTCNIDIKFFIQNLWSIKHHKPSISQGSAELFLLENISHPDPHVRIVGMTIPIPHQYKYAEKRINGMENKLSCRYRYWNVRLPRRDAKSRMLRHHNIGQRVGPDHRGQQLHRPEAALALAGWPNWQLESWIWTSALSENDYVNIYANNSWQKSFYF